MGSPGAKPRRGARRRSRRSTPARFSYRVRGTRAYVTVIAYALRMMGLSALVWAPFLLNVVDSDAGWIYPQWNTERTWALSVGVMLIAASAVVMVRAGRAHVRVGGGAVTVSNPFRTRVYDCADVQIINWSSVESGAAGTAAVGTGPFSPDAAGLGQTAPVVPGVALLVPGRRRPLRIVAFGSMSRTNEQVVRFAQALEGSKHRSRNE